MAAIAPLPTAKTGTGLNDNNSLLRDMLSAPLTFSEPVPRNNYKFDVRMKEVVPGRRSPPPSFARDLPASRAVNGDGKTGRKDGKGVEEGEEEKEGERERENGQSASPTASAVASPSTLKNSKIKTAATVTNGAGAVRPTAESTEPSPQVSRAPAPVSPATPKAGVTPREPASSLTSSHELYPAEVDLRWPDHLAHFKGAAAGLYNPSMACYANATLQVLLHTPPVLRIALAHEESSCLRTKRNLFCMVCHLREMAAEYHWGKKTRYPPRLHTELRYVKKGFSKNRQEDTHEFFRFVTDGLQAAATAGYPKETPDKIKHTSWVYRVWGGRVRSRVVCSRCQKPSDTFDDFLDLSLDVNKGGKKSIANMMAGFTREDRLEGDNKYHCDNCKAKANATKSFKIERAPPVLTLHLKRFSVNYNAYSGRARADKFNGYIEFPEFLDIAPYMVDQKVGGTRYRLFGVTCHRGVELRFGHYTSYVRGPQGTWFSADDDDVSRTRLSDVLSDKTAYLLSYIRVSDDAFPTSSKPVNGDASLANGYHSSPATPEVNGQAQKRARSSDSEDEEEEDEEAERPNVLVPRSKLQKLQKNGNRLIGPQLPMRIRKASPPTARPPSPEANGDAGGESEGDEDTSMPPELPSRFGSLMKSPKKAQIWAPKPIPPAQFYGNSPISRPPGPGPIARQDSYGPSSSSSRLSKKQKKKLDRAEKKKKSRGAGGLSPYDAARLSGNRSKGVLSRMRKK